MLEMAPEWRYGLFGRASFSSLTDPKLRTMAGRKRTCVLVELSELGIEAASKNRSRFTTLSAVSAPPPTQVSPTPRSRSGSNGFWQPMAKMPPGSQDRPPFADTGAGQTERGPRRQVNEYSFGDETTGRKSSGAE
jgi:hypothetical protein